MLKWHQSNSLITEQRSWHGHSPNLFRCAQGWALKRRQPVICGQPNGLFLTFAQHNSAICCGKSLSASRCSLWSWGRTNRTMRAVLSSWVQNWVHMDWFSFFLFIFFCCSTPFPHLCSALVSFIHAALAGHTFASKGLCKLQSTHQRLHLRHLLRQGIIPP